MTNANIITISVIEPVKINYYQVYLDLWTTDKTAADLAVTNDVPGLLTTKNNADTLKTTNFGNRNTLMTNSATVGTTAFNSYATYKAAYDTNSASAATATAYAAYKTDEDAYLANVAIQADFDTIKAVYTSEAAATLATFTHSTAVARPGIATSEKVKFEALMSTECKLGFTSNSSPVTY